MGTRSAIYCQQPEARRSPCRARPLLKAGRRRRGARRQGSVNTAGLRARPASTHVPGGIRLLPPPGVPSEVETKRHGNM